jgi:hypothetical protein
MTLSPVENADLTTRVYAGEAIRFRTVWVAEVAVGLAMVIYVATAARTTQTSARRHTS